MNDTHPEEQAPGTDEPEQTVKGPPISDLPPKGIPEIPVREETHFESQARRLLTWLAFLLVGVLIGALAVYWFANRPLNSDLNQSRQNSTDLQGQISTLETNNQDLQNQLTPLLTKNQDLQNQLNQNQTVIDLLSAQVDVSNARLSLSTKDLTAAQSALTHMDGTLKSLYNLVPSDQQSIVKGMQERLKLATGELTTNSFAADSDLTVLFKSLTDLAAKYPSTP